MHADYAQPAVGGQRGRSDLRTEIEIIQRNFVAEAIEFPELELISAQISFQNITANTKTVNIQADPETRIRKINLKIFHIEHEDSYSSCDFTEKKIPTH